MRHCIDMPTLQELRAVGMATLQLHAMPASTVDVSAFRRAMSPFPTGVDQTR
jgi:hypothetical protein